MEIYEWVMMVGMIVIIGFMWKLSHDMRILESGLSRDMGKLESRLTKEIQDLGERVAKIEGTIFHGVVFKEDKPIRNVITLRQL